MFVKFAALFVILASLALGQPAQQIQLGVPAPAQVITASANYTGTPGRAVLYYWVIAKHARGNSAPVGPAIVDRTATLSVSNTVKVTWQPAPNAYAYDVLRTSTPTLPGSCANCAIVTNTPLLSFTDTGATGAAYTVATTGPATNTILLDTSSAQPALTGLPLWEKYTLQKVANGQNGCAVSAGCWTVNGRYVADAAAAVSQSINIVALPANSWIHGALMKTRATWTGATTAVAFLGTTGDGSYFVTTPGYNLLTAAASTHIATSRQQGNTNLAAGSFVRVVLQTTVENVAQLANGATLDIWIFRSVLQ